MREKFRNRPTVLLGNYMIEQLCAYSCEPCRSGADAF